MRANNQEEKNKHKEEENMVTAQVKPEFNMGYFKRIEKFLQGDENFLQQIQGVHANFGIEGPTGEKILLRMGDGTIEMVENGSGNGDMAAGIALSQDGWEKLTGGVNPMFLMATKKIRLLGDYMKYSNLLGPMKKVIEILQGKQELPEAVTAAAQIGDVKITRETFAKRQRTEKDFALLDEYAKLYTPAISDAVDKLGLPSCFMDMGIRSMWHGARFVGYAGTVEFVPVPEGEQLDESQLVQGMEMIDAIQKGTVVVMTMHNVFTAAAWGQVTSMIARSAGCVGTVVDGPVRDLARVSDIQYPVFARGTVPSSIRGRFKPGKVNEPVLCGGVVVEAEDLIMADISGVVVVKQKDIEKVLETAKEIISADTWWEEQLEKGRKPAEIEREVPLP